MKQILFSLLIMITASSCYHVYYAPNTAHAPLLSEKGEVRINGLYASGGDSDFDGGEIQAAAAVSKNIGVMVNTMFVGKTESVSEWNGANAHDESGKGSYIEFAGGLFKNFDQKKKWIGEIYGGMGLGTANNTYEMNYASKVGITKFFIQPSVGYKSAYFEFILVPKISWVNWKVKTGESFSGGPNDPQPSFVYDLNNIRRKPSFINVEPSLILRAGGENFKLQGALSFSNFDDDYSPVETLNASVGISINLKPQKK